VWLDGNSTPEIDVTGIDTGTDNINRFIFGNFWQIDKTDANTLYIDDSFIRRGVASEPSTALAGAEGRYEYRKKLTIQYGEVGDSCSSNLSNFPVLVTLSGDWLKTKTTHVDGRIYNSNGYDIAFRGENDETVLNYEIEKYDGTNGILVAWVKIPTVYYNQNTDFYIYYGNAGITSAPAATVAQGVWDSNFIAVYHLKEQSGDQKNSKSDSLHLTSLTLTAQGTATGIANGADQFGGSDMADTGSTSAFDVASGDSLTVEAWIKTSTTGAYQFVVNRKDTDGDPTWQLLVDDSNKANFRFSDGSGHSPISSTNSVTNNTFVTLWEGGMDRPKRWKFMLTAPENSAENSLVGANAVTRPLDWSRRG
jgi:hypothetical protein